MALRAAGVTRPPRPLSKQQGLLLVVTALVGIGLVAAVGAVGRDRPAASGDTQFSARFTPRPPGATLAEQVSRLQDRVKARPKDWQAWSALGSLYVESARVSSDPSFYGKADGALSRSLSLQSDGNWAALAGKAAVANARHDFTAALSWADQAETLGPGQAVVLGARADALIELGRYDEGFDTIQRMVDLEPSLSSYARVAYARELQGDTDAAAEAWSAAEKVAPDAIGKSFAMFQLAELQWNRGNVDAARASYDRAARLDPTFVAPKAGLARVDWANGRIEEATAGYRAVVDRLPTPQYLTELADLYAVAGQPDRVNDQVILLEAQEQILRESGVNVDLEAALFSADHRRDLLRGLAAAQSEWDRRKSIFVADALAWQLHANGRHQEALVMSDEALRLGTANALFHYHRGMIELSLGHTAAARADLQRAVEINPNFSILHARSAAEVLASL